MNPRARRDDLLTTNLEDEVVVYDPERKQAHSLNRVAVSVWKHSDGTKTIEDLQRLVSDDMGFPIDKESVALALRKLEKAHLLLEMVASSNPMTRREMLGKAGKLGATAMATPLIVSALVPIAAAATSPSCAVACSTCGSIPHCGPSGTCLCTTSISTGACLCGENFVCGTTATCASDEDCTEAGFLFCQADQSGCCGAGVCVPACTGSPAIPAGAGPTNLG